MFPKFLSTSIIDVMVSQDIRNKVINFSWSSKFAFKHNFYLNKV